MKKFENYFGYGGIAIPDADWLKPRLINERNDCLKNAEIWESTMTDTIHNKKFIEDCREVAAAIDEILRDPEMFQTYVTLCKQTSISDFIQRIKHMGWFDNSTVNKIAALQRFCFSNQIEFNGSIEFLEQFSSIEELRAFYYQKMGLEFVSVNQVLEAYNTPNYRELARKAHVYILGDKIDYVNGTLETYAPYFVKEYKMGNVHVPDDLSLNNKFV